MTENALRKLTILREVIYRDAWQSCPVPITRIAGLAVIDNPFSTRFAENLELLFTMGETVGERLMGEMMRCLFAPAVSYGKAAIVGSDGDIEHGHALLHPKLGKAMRTPLGGGEALIPSSAKIGGIGTAIDIPLGHKDNAWSFDHFDAMTVAIADAPRANEIVLAIAIADGGRPMPRVGKARASL